MARRKKNVYVECVYLEMVKKNQAAYKRFLIIKAHPLWFCTISWRTSGEHSTKKGENNGEN